MQHIIFPAIIFLSAFLLFQVQPILTKELLPLFGGGSSIWSVSIWFYQTTLFLGYLYAHLMNRLTIKQQVLTHLTLITVSSVLTFLIETPIVTSDSSPAFELLIILLQQVGLVFLLLSSTSVLLQRWFYQSYSTEVPYHWYSVSNVASLIALISYPLLFEVYFSIPEQKSYWLTMLYTLLLLKLMLVIKLLRHGKQTQIEQPERVKTPVNTMLLWIAFPAISSIMLTTTTQMISTNIPPMPLIWLIPLVIYLGSFVYCFSNSAKYQRSIWLPILALSAFIGLFMFFIGSQLNSISQLLMYSFILLTCCLVCHGELRRYAPQDSSMSLFYLCIAGGSAIGSFIAAQLSPVIFETLTEYVLGLFLALFICFHGINKKRFKAAWGATILLFSASYLLLNSLFTQYNIASERNFYGFVSVKDIETEEIKERRLVDGTTVHGTQSLTDNNDAGSTYYTKDTGMAFSLNYIQQQGPLKLGVIGLGAGVIASYGRQEDTISFYELNPAVYNMADNYFSYLKDSKADIDVVIADGRIALAQLDTQQNEKFNALVIDAFSSDVIPAHLLTREAFELYFNRLEQDGVLLLHVSNNHIDLMPVIKAHSSFFNKTLLSFKQLESKQFGSNWLALSANSSYISRALQEPNVYRPIIDEQDSLSWTDQHYTLLPLMKFWSDE